MKHVLNLVGLFLLLLGFVMAADTPWGWAVAAVPVVYWLMGFLMLVHKSHLAALVFWGGVAYIQWQVALVAFVVFALVAGAKAAYAARDTVQGHRRTDRKRYNPATGLPMMGHRGMDMDSDGNPYNTF